MSRPTRIPHRYMDTLDQQMDAYIRQRDGTDEWRAQKKAACAILREKLDHEENPYGPFQQVINYLSKIIPWNGS